MLKLCKYPYNVFVKKITHINNFILIATNKSDTVRYSNKRFVSSPLRQQSHVQYATNIRIAPMMDNEQDTQVKPMTDGVMPTFDVLISGKAGV
jgi:hypothetical protein